MKMNEGPIDRILRITGGIVFLWAGFHFKNIWGYIIGGVLLATGAAGWCGLYALLGFSTCKKSCDSRK